MLTAKIFNNHECMPFKRLLYFRSLTEIAVKRLLPSIKNPLIPLR